MPKTYECEMNQADLAALVDALQDAVAFSMVIVPQYDGVIAARERWVAALETAGFPPFKPDLH